MNMLETIAPAYIEQLPDSDVAFPMIRVAGGTFEMGDENITYARPIHKVTVPDFHLGQYPVTQQVWEAVMGSNPSRLRGSNRPVERVSWDDVYVFIEKLNQLTDQNYRLPNEAEREYAARGGQQSLGFPYAGGRKLKEVAWYWPKSHAETKPVGLKLPNELGLYDMSGNVWEWCADHWHKNYDDAPTDCNAWISGGDEMRRVVRGGSWLNDDYNCHVAYRYGNVSFNRLNDVGFRLAR